MMAELSDRSDAPFKRNHSRQSYSSIASKPLGSVTTLKRTHPKQDSEDEIDNFPETAHFVIIFDDSLQLAPDVRSNPF